MVKIQGWSKYVVRSMQQNKHFLQNQFLQLKRPPTRSEVDRAYKLIEQTIAFVDGRYTRKTPRVDLAYLQSIRQKENGFFDLYRPDIPSLDNKFEKSPDYFKITPYDKTSYSTYFELIYRSLKKSPLANVDDISRIGLLFEFMAKARHFLIHSTYYPENNENLEGFFASVEEHVVPVDVTDHKAVYDSFTDPKHLLVVLIKSTIFGDQKALPPSAMTFIRNHVKYWPTVFFNENVKPTQWTKVVETKEVRETVASINANCMQRMNLVQFSEKKRVTVKPATQVGMVDLETEQVFSFYRDVARGRDQRDKEAQKLQIELKNVSSSCSSR
uniref:Uncharacterized protein n=1 Tax=Trichogramma kaykai TaxID=54128 RepID=A0ABD2X972_9HYME